jgi:hypothetical protein
MLARNSRSRIDTGKSAYVNRFQKFLDHEQTRNLSLVQSDSLDGLLTGVDVKVKSRLSQPIHQASSGADMISSARGAAQNHPSLAI